MLCSKARKLVNANNPFITLHPVGLLLAAAAAAATLVVDLISQLPPLVSYPVSQSVGLSLNSTPLRAFSLFWPAAGWFLFGLMTEHRVVTVCMRVGKSFSNLQSFNNFSNSTFPANLTLKPAATIRLTLLHLGVHLKYPPQSTVTKVS